MKRKRFKMRLLLCSTASCPLLFYMSDSIRVGLVSPYDPSGGFGANGQQRTVVNRVVFIPSLVHK